MNALALLLVLVAQTSDSGHILAPGDRIQIVVGSQTQDFVINPEGEILIKGLGAFEIANKTAASATADLDTAIRAKKIIVTSVTVFYLSSSAAPNVQVYGPVQRAGTAQALTVADAIREAAPDSRADLDHAIIDRGHGDTVEVNVSNIALGHDLDQNLKEGDRILIPRRPELAADTPQLVTIIGDVKSPGQFQAGTLTQVIASAGGTTNTSRTDAIHVRLPDGATKTYDLRRDNTILPANSTVFVESNEPRRQSMNDLRTFVGIFATIALLAMKLSI